MQSRIDMLDFAMSLSHYIGPSGTIESGFVVLIIVSLIIVLLLQASIKYHRSAAGTVRLLVVIHQPAVSYRILTFLQPVMAGFIPKSSLSSNAASLPLSKASSEDMNSIGYPEIEATTDFDWQAIEPKRYRPYKPKYNLTMCEYLWSLYQSFSAKLDSN